MGQVLQTFTHPAAENIAIDKKVDLRNKVAVVTGANTGIGKETARVLALAGAKVILACRDAKKAQSALDEIAQTTGNNDVEAMSIDLTSLDSVRKFAKEFLEKNVPLHILVCNAGIMGLTTRQETKDNLEMQMGVNHFAHFLLVNLLLKKLRESAPSRVVMVSSVAHNRSFGLDFEDINLVKNYKPFVAYGNSKLANIYFAKELSRRMRDTGVVAVALHPGVIMTELTRSNGLANLVYIVGYPFTKSIPRGAATSVYCCLAQDIVPGGYYQDCHIADPSSTALDSEAAKKLWDVSVQLTKLTPQDVEGAFPESKL